MVPESKFNGLTRTDILKLHVHDDASIQEINVSENGDWIYIQRTLNSGICPDLQKILPENLNSHTFVNKN